MSEGKSQARRRQVFGGFLLVIAVALLAIAIWGRVRRLSYIAMLCAGVGVWMISRRGK